MLATLGRVKQLSPAEGGPKERLQARAISDRASQQLGCLVGQYTNHTNTEGCAVGPGTQPQSQGDQVTQEPGLLASTSGPRPPPPQLRGLPLLSESTIIYSTGESPCGDVSDDTSSDLSVICPGWSDVRGQMCTV